MVNYADKELFYEDGISKNLIITYDNVTLTNSDIVSESFELTETLCAEENIALGSCNASQIKFRIGYIAESLIGKILTVSIQPHGGGPLQIGIYKVESDKRTADRRYKDIVAYDVMKDILETDVAGWYKGLFTTPTATYTLKQFRDSFFTHLGVTQESTTLINDTLTVSYTIDPEKLSGRDVITKICEINGCFGHIGRDGLFHYIALGNIIPALYPAEDLYPSETLYPSDGNNVENIGENGTYIGADYEDYETAPITKLQIRQSEDDIGAVIGSGTNCYVIEDNFLVYGLNAAALESVGTPILSKLGNIQYIPMKIELLGNPCFEVGDGIQFITRYAVIYSYIFKRTLKGVQTLFDVFETSGTETLGTNINSVNSQITQLKGRTNKLIRTVDETISELNAYETTTDGTLTSYNTRITQNASGITSLATATTDATNPNSLQSQITQNAGQIALSVKNDGTGLQSAITLNPSALEFNANKIIVDSTYFKLYANGTGKLGGLSFDADGFYSVLNGAKVLRVYPNPNDYVLSLGPQTITRLRTNPDFYLDDDNFDFEVDANGNMEITTLNILDRWSGYSVTKQGTLHVDSFINCYGNIECGVHGVTPSGIAGSIWSHYTSGHSASGCVNAEHNIYARGTNGGTGDIQAAHDVIYGNSCYQGSDKRLKKSIKDLKNSEELIYNLRPVEFRYKRDDSAVHHGFIAQDVEKLVDEESAIIHRDDEGMMSVGYIELIADMVNTIQSQNKRISELEERLARLEEKING